jgi:hypothetical protein
VQIASVCSHPLTAALLDLFKLCAQQTHATTPLMLCLMIYAAPPPPPPNCVEPDGLTFCDGQFPETLVEVPVDLSLTSLDSQAAYLSILLLLLLLYFCTFVLLFLLFFFFFFDMQQCCLQKELRQSRSVWEQQHSLRQYLQEVHLLADSRSMPWLRI